MDLDALTHNSPNIRSMIQRPFSGVFGRLTPAGAPGNQRARGGVHENDPCESPHAEHPRGGE